MWLKGRSRPGSNELRYFDALRRIAKDYDSANKVIRTAGKRYALEGAEALAMAYENIQEEAAYAIKGRSRPTE